MNSDTKFLTTDSSDVVELFERSIFNIREDMRNNPYIIEALKVLQVQGYRSAIGCIWNAVIDDLRNKVIARSLDLFNETQTLRREIKTYEDFQDHVNDDELLEGAYLIGVISWEGRKVLKHAKETRHIFDGHPRSSDPSALKVLAMLDDCIRYVLAIDYPHQIINIDEYISMMSETGFDRNIVSIETALLELPEVYKNQLAHRFYITYIGNETSSTLKSNIAFVAPILWKGLTKGVKIEISRKVDREIAQADKEMTNMAFEFIRLVGSEQYLSTVARKYIIQPVVERLNDHRFNFSVEDDCISELEPYASFIPDELMELYVSSIVTTYVGTMGNSSRYVRTDWFANQAALKIPSMVEQFDDKMAGVFIDFVQTSKVLAREISHPVKLRRLRNLAIIISGRISTHFPDIDFLEILVDEKKEEEFYKALRIEK